MHMSFTCRNSLGFGFNDFRPSRMHVYYEHCARLATFLIKIESTGDWSEAVCGHKAV